MSDITTDQFLDMLQRSGGARNLDLEGRDLSGINLSGEVLEEMLEEQGYGNGSGGRPAWFEPWTKGVALSRAHLRSAQLRMADLRNACLENADLRDSDLTGAFLQDATLEGADLRGANLTGAVLSHTILWGKFSSLEGAHLYGAHIEFAPCTRDQFGRGIGEELGRDWMRARESYLALRHNFLDLGRYTDASWAYRKERRMERAIAFPTEEGGRWLRDELSAERSGWKKGLSDGLLRPLLFTRLYLKPPSGVPVRRWQHFGNWVQDVLCEYGENPWRLGLWAGAVVFVFALLHFLLDWISPEPVTLALMAGAPRPPLEYLAFSFASLAAMNFVRIEPVSTLGIFLASIQAAVGVGLLALFMFTMGRRMSGN